MTENYQAYYASLRKLKQPLNAEDGLSVARRLVQLDCTPHAFRALLDHTPPLETILQNENEGYFATNLVNDAAAHSTRLLDLMLRLGVSPNWRRQNDPSPLEIAVHMGNQASVRRLLREPELDRTMTVRLWRLWAGAEESPKVRRCWQLAAPQLAGAEMPASGPVPLLEGVTLEIAAEVGNWDMICRLCRERDGLTVEQAVEVLEQLINFFINTNQPPFAELARVLDAMFSVCPALLEEKRPQQILLLCYLEAPEASPVLLGWLDQLPVQAVPLWLEQSGLTERPWGGKYGLLKRWQERLGSRLLPVLKRNLVLPFNGTWLNLFGDDEDEYGSLHMEPEAADEIVRACTVCGEPPEGKLSRLARSVLKRCSAGLVLELLETGGFLAQEDPAALLDFAEQCSWETRKVLAACVKVKPESYELS